ncbi:MAG TPA: efflux transporter outer membrane subunit [Nevskiaceae bacterium]|nr:efflux transporter outer membrane subunit [Nevskiaceae bacterium]
MQLNKRAGRLIGSCTTLAVTLALAGCAVGPDYHAPPAPAVSRYTATPLPATAGHAGTVDEQRFVVGGSLPAQWWTLFGSKQINTLIDSALRNNPDLASARAALKQAHEDYLANLGALYPTVNLQWNSTRQKSSGALFGQPGLPSNIFSLHQAQAQVSYNVSVFGGVRRGIEAAKSVVAQQGFELDAARLSLTANVVTSAIQVAALNTQITTQLEVVKAETQIADTLRKQVQLGGASRAALQQQLTQVATSAAQLAPLHKQLHAAQNELAILTGHLPSQAPAVQLDLAALTLPAQVPVSLPSQLVEQRPDVQAAAAQLQQANALVGIAIANRLPQFTITAAIGSVATHPSELFSPGGGIWSIGGAALQPLFHGGTLLHKQRAAKAAYQQALAQYRSTVLLAFRNVADSLQALTTDAQALTAQDRAEQAAAASYRIAKAQFTAGGIAYPALLQSQLSWQQTRNAVVQAKAARFTDTAALFQALGGGWWHSGHKSGDPHVATRSTGTADKALAD